MPRLNDGTLWYDSLDEPTNKLAGRWESAVETLHTLIGVREFIGNGGFLLTLLPGGFVTWMTLSAWWGVVGVAVATLLGAMVIGGFNWYGNRAQQRAWEGLLARQQDGTVMLTTGAAFLALQTALDRHYQHAAMLREGGSSNQLKHRHLVPYTKAAWQLPHGPQLSELAATRAAAMVEEFEGAVT